MHLSIPPPQRATSLQALGAAFIDTLYLKLALPHNLAVELGSDQIAAAYGAGTWPSSEWPQDSLAKAIADLSKLKRSIRVSALIALSLAVLGLLLAAAFGKVHPSLPVDFGKVIASVGATLLTWGAILQLHPARASVRATMLHEVAHAMLVRSLIIAGSALAAAGVLWWQ